MTEISKGKQMLDFSGIRVVPKPAFLSTSKLEWIRNETKPDRLAIGIHAIVLFPIFFGLIAAALAAVGGEDFACVTVIIGIPIAVITSILLNNVYSKSQFRRSVAVFSKQELDERFKEAEAVRDESVEALKTSIHASRSLPYILLQAQQCLEKAEIEFQTRAFGPFWDAIEAGARSLDNYYKSVNQITVSAKRYYELLQGYDHNFPSFRAKVDSPPSPISVVDNLQATARRAQTDFEFATIWEHRQTRKVLIAGFEHLGDALYNIGNVLSGSISSLEDTLRSEMARSVEQHTKAKEDARIASEKEMKILEEIRDK